MKLKSIALFVMLLSINSINIFAITKGQTVTFTGVWEGPNSDGVTAKFNLNNVKIEVYDTTSGQAVLLSNLTGIVANGKYIFQAPSSSFKYKIYAVNASGSMSVKDNAGIIYSWEVIGNSYTAPRNTIPADVWSVFHGMDEMITRAKQELSVAKAPFSVIFPYSATSKFNGVNVYINGKDRYDWDVIAHEFGHAISQQTNAINNYAGGSHNGTNQYDYNDTKYPNTTTYHNKKQALNLAFNEAFGTWIGGALLENSSYKGKFLNVGDKKYDDTEDFSDPKNDTHFPFEPSSAPEYFGDDAEFALANLLWDLSDDSSGSVSLGNLGLDDQDDYIRSQNTDAETKASDKVNTTYLSGVWKLMNNEFLQNISDFWVNNFLPLNDKTAKGYLPPAGTALSATNVVNLSKALDAADIFSEFGVAPLIYGLQSGDILKLVRGPNDPPPKALKWKQLLTSSTDTTGANSKLKLNIFTLVLYTADYKYLVFQKDVTNKTSYTLTDSDLQSINGVVLNLQNKGVKIDAVKAIIIGSQDTVKSGQNLPTGPYFSNALEWLIQPYDRLVVAVVDESGSMTVTDPTRLRVVASKQSLHNLISIADAKAKGLAVDLAGTVAFSSTSRTLSAIVDPDVAEPTLNGVGESGGTDIASGINRAVNMISTFTIPGLKTSFLNRTAILVFTDGENNAGEAPVIQAIDNAKSKGIRVHYGFLQPYTTFKTGGDLHGDFSPIGTNSAISTSNAVPATSSATIEEAVLASGGTYAVIVDADSQVAFVNQIYGQGITNINDDKTPGGLIVGQTNTTGLLTSAVNTNSWHFTGKKSEKVTVFVDSATFDPNVTVFSTDGKILSTGNDTDKDGETKLAFTLPVAGDYSVRIYSQDGKVGLYTIFVDVANPPIVTLPVVDTTSSIVLNKQTGFFDQTVTVVNKTTVTTTGFKILVGNLVNGATLYNKSGVTASGVPYILVNTPLAAGARMNVAMQYYVDNRIAPSPTFTIVSSTTP